MYNPVLSVPARRDSGWVAQTDPGHARVWLSSLPIASGGLDTAREVYQALYTVNRQDLRLNVRLELMGLYEPVVATIGVALHSHLAHASPPLNPKTRELAEFLRRLHVEMAYGYKVGLRDINRARLLLGRKSRFAQCMERVLYHLNEVLQRSYFVYIPCPPGVWREIHELYRVAESLRVVREPVTIDGSPITIEERYLQTVLLGLANPYHLPHNGVQQVHSFLLKCAKQAQIVPVAMGTGQQAHFLIDLTTDAPPAPFTWDARWSSGTERLLDVQELLRNLRSYIGRLEKGESIEAVVLGLDARDAGTVDLMRRLLRAWGDSVRRRYARHQRNSTVSVCIGLQSLYFFSNDQRPFARTTEKLSREAIDFTSGTLSDVAFVELDDVENQPVSANSAAETTGENHRVDAWQLRDIGPQGLSLAQYGDAATALRVGELLGIQQTADQGRWRAAVVRWIKSPDTGSLEAGLELLAAAITPIAARVAPTSAGKIRDWFPALWLPAVEVTRRPPTLLLGRGACRVGDELELVEGEGAPRRVRVLRLLERTGSFEQIVYADVVRN
jgi:cyclic-di-GMP-binding protein